MGDTVSYFYLFEAGCKVRFHVLLYTGVSVKFFIPCQCWRVVRCLWFAIWVLIFYQNTCGFDFGFFEV